MLFKVNTAAQIAFSPVHKTTGAAITSGTPSTTIVGITNAVVGISTSTSNTATHQTNGIWILNLTASEMNHSLVAVQFSMANAVPQLVQLRTVNKLVSELNDFNPSTNSVDISRVRGLTVGGITSFHGSTSGLSTFDPNSDMVTVGNTVAANIVQVNGVGVTIGDFRSSLTVGQITNAFAGMTLAANIVQVNGVTVAISDFKADVSNLSTFDPTVDRVDLIDNAVRDVTVSDAVIQDIATTLLEQTIDGSVDLEQIYHMLLAFMAGKLTVVDNGSTRTFTFYKRDNSSISFEVEASESTGNEGQRTIGGTVGS